MVVELINTGSELMLGFVLNTHQQWLCRKLADLGLPVSRQVAVPDSGDAIQEAVRESLARADLILVTGGLGPTSDDQTRHHLAALLERPLHEDPAMLTQIENFFALRNRPMPPRTRVQALVLEGAMVLENRHGTAPGLALEIPAGKFRTGSKSTWLILLPGPPRELRPMFLDQVIPLIQQSILLDPIPFVCRILKTTGLGESLVEDQIAGPLSALIVGGLEIGYCARPGEVDLRLVASGPGAAARVGAAENIVRQILGRSIFAVSEELLEDIIVHELTARGETLAVAESCTGGYIAHRITNVPGASAVFVGGLVTYSNQAKETFLGVQHKTLERFGAVSEAAAREMAEGARARCGSAYGLAVTGIAGPTGGSPEKPVGTVFMGLASARNTAVRQALNPYDRETFKQITSQQALNLLRERMAGNIS